MGRKGKPFFETDKRQGFQGREGQEKEGFICWRCYWPNCKFYSVWFWLIVSYCLMNYSSLFFPMFFYKSAMMYFCSDIFHSSCAICHRQVAQLLWKPSNENDIWVYNVWTKCLNKFEIWKYESLWKGCKN